MKKKLTMFYALLLALSLILSGCQGDAGPAGTPGADGTNGTSGVTGPQGPVGQTGTTGALIADPFKATQFHGSAVAPEATRGPNNSANLCTTITAASVDPTTGKLVVDFTVKSSGADKVPCTGDDVAYTGVLPASSMTFRFAQLRNGENTGDSTYWVNYVNVSKTATIGPGFATVPVTKMNQGSGETGSTAGGTWTDNGNGTYRYVTNKKLTDGITIADPPKAGTYAYDANLTHRVGIQMGDPDGTGAATMGANNAIYDFVPGAGGNGPQVADPRELVVIANCNECHKTLGLHGGGRLDTKMCVICHNPTQGEPNSMNIIDFKIMVHKIHMGKHLPSVVAGTPYVIYGYGTPPSKHDYSYVNFPAYPANCTKCHKNATKAGNYKTNPNKEACGACHDLIDFSTGTGTRVSGVTQVVGSGFASSNVTQNNHVGGIKTNADCTSCHQSSGTQGAIDTDPAPIPDTHDFMKKITSKNTVTITVSGQTGVNTDGSPYFKLNDTPKVTIVLKDAAGNPIDPTTITDTAYPAGRVTTGGGLNLYVSGPRAKRVPVLSTVAKRPDFFSVTNTTTGVKAAGTTGNDLRIRVGTVTAGTAQPAQPLEDDFGKIKNADGTFTTDATKVTGVIDRTDTTKIEYKLAPITADMVPAPAVGGGTSTNNTYVVFVYFYQPNAKTIAAFDLKTFKVGPGADEKKVATGCLDCHSSGTQAAVDAGDTTVVKNVWHISAMYEHPAQFDPDYCGNCHDYLAPIGAQDPATGAGAWGSNKLGFGAMPVSRRLHAVHFGARLNFPADNPGIAFANAAFPQDVRNCEKCHPKGTSTGTWQLTSTDQTDPATGLLLTAKQEARIACSGCHDSNNAWVHMKTMTFDPTPLTSPAPSGAVGIKNVGNGIYVSPGVFYSWAAGSTGGTGPFSGDEQESCKACHAPLGLGAAGTATGTLGALQAPKLTN